VSVRQVAYLISLLPVAHPRTKGLSKLIIIFHPCRYDIHP
jgi:hypothetical protein